MKHLPLFLISLILLCVFGCGRTDKNNNIVSNSPSFIQERLKHYENDYFSFDYPYDMTIEEEINHISDTINGLKKGLSITLYHNNLPIQFLFVKSAMYDVFDTPEQWRDLSIQLKEIADSNYIGYYDVEDSLYFNDTPAASVTFAFKGEHGDTLVQHQMVVLRKNKDLFFLNYIAPTYLYNGEGEAPITIFDSFQFK